MKVLMVSPTFFPIVGGAELLIRDVGNVWADEHEVRLLTPRLPEHTRPFWIEADACRNTCDFEVEQFDDRISLMKLRGHKLARGLIPPMSLSATTVLLREARRMRADVLMGFFGVPYGLPLAIVSARLGVPYMLVLCGTDLPSPRTADLPFWPRYLRFATRRANKVAYVSKSAFHALNRGPHDPLHDRIIYGGVHVHQRASRLDAEALRARLGISDDETMLFALQRLGCEKRVDVLIRALAELRELPRRVRLVVGGQGAELEPLKELAVRIGVSSEVIFTGHLGVEKDVYYEACDIFVFHSLFETFGQVLAEAMAAGKPVVSVRAGAIPEVVEHGVTGLLAQPVDHRGMARHIAELVIDDARRAKLGTAGRRRAFELFDWAKARVQWTEFVQPTAALGQADFAAEAKRVRTEAGS